MEHVQATCKLVAQDDEGVEVPRTVAVLSGLVEEILSDEEDNVTCVHIPLPNMKLNILKLVVEFCTFNFNSPMPEIEKPLKVRLSLEVL